ncbi:MAG: carboxypeptidase regulatory-like domain-containing protein [Elusimicrobia bacterium]|nr:carboxypeptidase regulatory-like domain-containing protein [Elusimicrobiota bacterium]
MSRRRAKVAGVLSAALLAAAALEVQAAVPKSGAAADITMDLLTGQAGSVGLSGGAITVSGALGQAAHIESASGGTRIRSGYFAQVIGGSGPVTGVTTPVIDSYINNLSAIQGTAAAFGGLAVSTVSVAVQRLSDNLYWDGSGFTQSAAQFFEAAFAGASSGTWSYSAGPLASALTNGASYQIQSQVRDSLGKTQWPVYPSTFTFDNIAPVSGSSAPAPGRAYPSLTALAGTASDAASPIQSAVVSIRREEDGKFFNGVDFLNAGGTWLAVTQLFTSSWVYTNGSLVFADQKHYVVTSSATDAAGNVQSSSAPARMLFDTTPPVSGAAVPANGLTYAENTAIAGTSSDPGFTTAIDGTGSGVYPTLGWHAGKAELLVFRDTEPFISNPGPIAYAGWDATGYFWNGSTWTPASGGPVWVQAPFMDALGNWQYTGLACPVPNPTNLPCWMRGQPHVVWSRAVDNAGNIQSVVSAGAKHNIAAPAVSFGLSVSADPAQAGTTVDLTVEAKDDIGARAMGYNGTVRFYADPGAGPESMGDGLPSEYTFLQADNGIKTITSQMQLRKAGVRALRVEDKTNAAIFGTLNANVNPAPAAKLRVLMPGETRAAGSAISRTGTPLTQTAGSVLAVTVDLADAYWNLTLGTSQQVRLFADDPYAVLPPDQVIVGSAALNATLKRAGSTLIRAEMVSDPPAWGPTLSKDTGTALSVFSGMPSKLLLKLPGESFKPGSPTGKSGTPAPAAAGQSYSVVAGVTDDYYNLVVGRVAEVQILTPNDPFSPSVSTAAMNTGTGYTSAILVDLRNAATGHYLTATDYDGSGLLDSISSTFTVNAAPPMGLQVLLPGQSAAPGSGNYPLGGVTGSVSTRTAGAPFNVVVNLVDRYMNRCPGSLPQFYVATSDDFDIDSSTLPLVNGSQTVQVNLVSKTANAAVGAYPEDQVSNRVCTGNASPFICRADSPAAIPQPFKVYASAASKLQVLLPGETAVQGKCDVSPGVVCKFNVSVDTAGKSGAPVSRLIQTAFQATVNLVDDYFNLATERVGAAQDTNPPAVMPEVQVSLLDDSLASAPAAQALSLGSRAFTLAPLTALSTYTVSAATTVASAATYLSGNSADMRVYPGPAHHLHFGGLPGSPTAGVTFSYALSAHDQFHNLLSTGPNVYVGAVALSAEAFGPPQGPVFIPPSFSFTTLDAGVKAMTDSVILKKAGSRWLKAEQADNPSINTEVTGYSTRPSIEVVPAVPVSAAVLPGPAGQTVTVRAGSLLAPGFQEFSGQVSDAFGNTVIVGATVYVQVAGVSGSTGSLAYNPGSGWVQLGASTQMVTDAKGRIGYNGDADNTNPPLAYFISVKSGDFARVWIGTMAAPADIAPFISVDRNLSAVLVSTGGTPSQVVVVSSTPQAAVSSGLGGGGAFVVERRDDFSNPTDLGATTINLSLPPGELAAHAAAGYVSGTDFGFVDPSAAYPITSINILDGLTQAGLRYRDKMSSYAGTSPAQNRGDGGRPGRWTLQIIPGAPSVSSATALMQLDPEAPAKLGFGNALSTQAAGKVQDLAGTLRPFRAQQQDLFGNPALSASPVNVGLASVSRRPSALNDSFSFSVSSEIAAGQVPVFVNPVSVVAIPPLMSETTFYYLDTMASSSYPPVEPNRPVIGISDLASVLTSRAQAVNILPDYIERIVVLPLADSALQAGAASQPETLQLHDRFGNASAVLPGQEDPGKNYAEFNLTSNSPGNRRFSSPGPDAFVLSTGAARIGTGASSATFHVMDDILSSATWTLMGNSVIDRGWAVVTATYSVRSVSSGITFPNILKVPSLPAISGTAQAFGAEVSSVRLYIRRLADGQYWNGSSWQASAVFNAAAFSGFSSGTWSYSGLSAGALTNGASYQIESEARDTGSRTQLTPSAYAFVYDTRLPAAAILLPVNGAFYGSLPMISGTGADAVNVSTVSLSVQDTSAGGSDNCYSPAANSFIAACPGWFAAQGSTAAWSYGFSAPPWTNGRRYAAFARATDVIGQVSLVSTRAFGFDTSAPVLYVAAPAGGTIVAGLPWISGTAWDFSGMNPIEMRFTRLPDGRHWDFVSSTWTPSTTLAPSAIAVFPAASTWTYVLSAALREALVSGNDYVAAARGQDVSIPANPGSLYANPSTFTYVDAVAPAAVTDLSAAFGGAPGQLELAWTAPGDDGTELRLSSGSMFKIEYATAASAAWGTAFAQLTLSAAGAQAGQRQDASVPSLAGDATYFLRVWTVDESSNASSASTAASAYMPPIATRLVLAAPGETFVSRTGIAGAPSLQAVFTPFSVSVYAVDPSTTLVPGAVGAVSLSAANDPGAIISPASAPLVNGSAAFSVSLSLAQLAMLNASISPAGLAGASKQVTALSGVSLLVDSAQDIAPASIQQGAGNVGMLKLRVRANAGTVSWSALRLSLAGSGAMADVRGVSLFKDFNGNGSLDSNADILIASRTSGVAGVYDLPFAARAISVSTETYFVALSLAGTAVVGSSYGLAVSATGFFTVSGGGVAAQALYPILSSLSSVTSPNSSSGDAAPPVSAVTFPMNGSSPDTLAFLSGTAADNVAVSRVDVAVRRKSDGKWWDGAAWSYSSTPLASTASYIVPGWTYFSGPSSPSLALGGLYEILAWAKDAAGNSQSSAAVALVTISSSAAQGDHTPPVSVILYPADASVLNSLGALSGTAADNAAVSKVEAALFEHGAGRWWNGAGWSAGGMLLNAVPLSNGFWSYAGPDASYLASGSSYTVYARAMDSSGNLQNPPVCSSFTYQTAAPSVSSPTAVVTLPAAGALVATLSQISGTVSGDAGEIRVRILSLSDGRYWKGSTREWLSVFTDNFASFGAGYWSYGQGPDAASLLANSSYTASVWAKNPAGTLIQTPPQTLAVFTSTSGVGPQDATPPSAAILSPAAGAQTLVSLGAISGTAVDNDRVSQIFVAVKRLADGLWWGEGAWLGSKTSNQGNAASPGSAMTLWSYSALPDSYLSVNSSYTILVWARDASNNISATPAQRTFAFGAAVSVDTVAPAAVTDLVARSTEAGIVELTWKAPGDDVSVGTAARYHVHYSTLGPLTPSNFFGDAARKADDQYAMARAGVYDAALPPLKTAVPAPQAPSSTETLILYGLEPGKVYFFAVRAQDKADNLSPYFNSAWAQVPLSVAPGDGSGTASWSPSSVPVCGLVTATVTFTMSTHTFKAGGLVAAQLPDGWPSAQVVCSTCPAYLRVESTSAASLQPVLLPELGERWAGAVVSAGQLMGSEEVKLAFDRLSVPRTVQSNISVLVRSRASWSGEAKLTASPARVHQIVGPAQAVRFSDQSLLVLGPYQASAAQALVGIDACGNPSAPALEKSVTLEAQAGAQFALEPNFATPLASLVVPLSAASSSAFYYRNSTAGDQTMSAAYFDFADLSSTRRALRPVRVVGSAVGFVPGSLKVSTASFVPPRTTAAITPDGDGTADRAYFSFIPLDLSAQWRLTLSTTNDFSTLWRQFTGTGEPGRTLVWDGTDINGRIRPGTYHAKLEASGGAWVDTTTLSVEVAAVGISGKVKLAEVLLSSGAKISLSGPLYSRREISDSSGNFAFYGLRAGATYYVSGEYYDPSSGRMAYSTMTLSAPAEADLALSLSPRIRVAARLPMPAASELWGSLRLKNLAFTRQSQGRLHFAAGSLGSDDGAAAYGGTPSSWTVLDVQPDTYVVTMELTGYESLVSTRILSAGTLLDLTPVFARKANVYGIVQLPEVQDQGVAVSIEARRSGAEAAAASASLYLPGKSDAGKIPASDGVFTLAGLDPGTYTVTGRAIGFEDSAYGPIEVLGEDVGSLQWPAFSLPVFTYGGIITGTVTVQGDTLARGPYSLVVNAWNQRTFASSFIRVAFSPSNAFSSAPYRLSGLANGEYRLMTSLTGFEQVYEAGGVGVSTVSVSGSGGAASKDLLLRQSSGRVKFTFKLPAGYADYDAVSFTLQGEGVSISTSPSAASWTSAATLGTGIYRLSAIYRRAGATADATLPMVSGQTSEASLDLTGSTKRVSGSATLSGSVSLNLGSYTFTAGTLADLAAAAAMSPFCGRAYAGCVSTTSLRLELYPPSASGSSDGYFAPIRPDGVFAFENVPSGYYTLVNRAELDGDSADGVETGVAAQTVIVGTAPVLGLQVSLLGGREVRGRFRLPDGRTDTRSFAVGLRDRDGVETQSQSVRLNADGATGEFRLTHVSDGGYLLSVRDAGTPLRYIAVPVPVRVQGADVDLPDMALYLAAGIRGAIRLRQVSVEGSSTVVRVTPITASNLSLLPETLQVSATAEPWVEGGTGSAERSGARLALDAYDRFAIPGLVPGVYKVSFIQGQGGGDWLGRGSFNLAPKEITGIRLEEGQSQDIGAVELTPAQSVSGAVQDAAGNPLPNIQVMAEAVSRDHRVETQTDANGRFILSGLDPARRYYDIIAAVREGEEEQNTSRLPYGETVLAGVDILTRYSGLSLTLERADAKLQCRLSAKYGGSLVNPDPRHKDRPGGKVWVQRSDRLPRTNPLGDIEILTLPDGSFTVQSLAPAAYRLTGSALNYRHVSKSIALRSGTNSNCSLSLDSGGTLTGTITHADGSYPSRSEVERLMAVPSDGTEALIGDMESPGNSAVVDKYRISGFKAGLTYQILLMDVDGDVFGPPEAEAVRFDGAEDQALDIRFKPSRPSVSFSSNQRGQTRVFDLTFKTSKPLRSRTDEDDVASLRVSVSTGTLSQAQIKSDRRSLSAALDASGISAASITVHFSAFSNLLDPDSTDQVNPELAMETTGVVYVGVTAVNENRVTAQQGGRAGVGGEDPSHVVLPAGALQVAASSVVVVGMQSATVSRPGQGRGQGARRLLSASAYPQAFYKALAAAPPGIRPLSAFYDIFLPLGLRTQLRKPAELVIKYDTATVSDPAKLNLYWYNEAAGAYILQQDLLGYAPEVDPVNHTIKVRVNHFSTFVLINSQAVVITDTGTFSGGELEAFNYPNPFDLSDKEVDLTQAGRKEFVRGTMIRVGLPSGMSGAGKILIFNVAGERVRSLEFAATVGGRYNYVEWDGRNDSGKDAASGVYIAEVKVGGEKKFFKMALIK